MGRTSLATVRVVIVPLIAPSRKPAKRSASGTGAPVVSCALMKASSPKSTPNASVGKRAQNDSCDLARVRRERSALSFHEPTDVDHGRDARFDRVHHAHPFGIGLGELREVGPLLLEDGSKLREHAASERGEVGLSRNSRSCDGGQGDAAGVDVIWVVVATELVVRHDDVGAVTLEQAREAFGGILDGDVAERVGTVLVLPFDHARVVVPEQLEVRDTERLACSLELAEPDAGDLGLVVAFSPGLIPPGPSPSSPFVHVTTTVRTPSAAYRAKTPPVLDDSSSGCACTAITVSGVLIREACHDAIWPLDTKRSSRAMAGLLPTDRRIEQADGHVCDRG